MRTFLIPHRPEDRQRDHLARSRLGLGEVALAVAEVRQRALQVQRPRVVHGGVDAALREPGPDPVTLLPADADHVLVERPVGERATGGQRDPGQACQRSVVRGGDTGSGGQGLVDP